MITELPYFITSADCDRLIQFNDNKHRYDIRTNLARFPIENDENLKPDKFSEGILLRKDNPFVNNLLHKVSKFIGVPYENLESPMVTKYELNKEYEPHYDWIFRKKELEAGNRIKTFLIYLNYDLGGGETYFPNINVKITPQKGKAIFWYNANPNKLDTLNEKSLHSSMAAVKKNKYIFIVWAREKEFIDYKWERYMEDGLIRLPLIYEEHKKFLSKELCKELIEWFTDETRAEKGLMTLFPGQTVNFQTKEGKRETSDYRVAKNLFFKKDGVIAQKFSDRLCKILGVGTEYLEGWIFIKYEKGGEYKEHPDFVDEEGIYAEFDKKKRGGLRLKTVLIYLNDDFEGGETWFPNIDLKIKPETGKLVIWDNVLTNLKPNKFSIHAGLPIKEGNKYIILTWVRQEKR